MEVEPVVENDFKSRNQEFFTSCKPDNRYIFQHEIYEWDDVVNAFIAGGLYADSHPEYPWKRFDKHGKWMENVEEHLTYEVCNVEDGRADILSGNEIIHAMFLNPNMYTHYRLFVYPLNLKL